MNHTPNTEQREREAFEAIAAKYEIEVSPPSDSAIKLGETRPYKYTHTNHLFDIFMEGYRAAAATKAAPASPNTGAVKDHVIREFVNELRDIAIKFHAAGQLRERIAYAVGDFLDKSTPSPSKGGEAAPADPCPQCQPGGVCKTPACGRLRSSELMALYGTGKGGEADSAAEDNTGKES